MIYQWNLWWEDGFTNFQEEVIKHSEFWAQGSWGTVFLRVVGGTWTNLSPKEATHSNSLVMRHNKPIKTQRLSREMDCVGRKRSHRGCRGHKQAYGKETFYEIWVCGGDIFWEADELLLSIPMIFRWFPEQVWVTNLIYRNEWLPWEPTCIKVDHGVIWCIWDWDWKITGHCMELENDNSLDNKGVPIQYSPKHSLQDSMQVHIPIVFYPHHGTKLVWWI